MGKELAGQAWGSEFYPQQKKLPMVAQDCNPGFGEGHMGRSLVLASQMEPHRAPGPSERPRLTKQNAWLPRNDF